MIEYILFHEVGRHRALEQVAVYRFIAEPHSGDTIAIGEDVWTVDRRHWREDGTAILVVRKPQRGLVPA